ncbi:MAG TPA: sigma-70 family RNA polymerase sigma factor [Pirellulales bacterium]
MLDAPTQLLVSRGLKEGSRDAWAKLYFAYSVELWRYVARLVGSDAAAVADIVQESFLDAARSARQFDSDRGTLWNWLCGIAHHRVLAYWRQSSRTRRLLETIEQRPGEFASPLVEGAVLDASLQHKEISEVVHYVLAQLPLDYSALLAAKYCDDRSLDELAKHTGGTVDAVKSKLARARREFRLVYERMAQPAAAAAR